MPVSKNKAVHCHKLHHRSGKKCAVRCGHVFVVSKLPQMATDMVGCMREAYAINRSQAEGGRHHGPAKQPILYIAIARYNAYVQY